jgi:hypothetical protein
MVDPDEHAFGRSCYGSSPRRLLPQRSAARLPRADRRDRPRPPSGESKAKRRARPRALVKDVIMRPTTTAAVALAGAATVLPAAAQAEPQDPPSPTDTALAAPFGGHLTVEARLRAEGREAAAERLTPRVITLSRKLARARGEDFSRRAERRRLRGDSPADLRERIRSTRRELRATKRAAATPAAAANTTAAPHLEAIAACESGGDPTAIGGGGAYRGKYQFDYSTWASVGGSGDPAAAPEAEQDRRAAMLYAQQGASPWPVCGG